MVDVITNYRTGRSISENKVDKFVRFMISKADWSALCANTGVLKLKTLESKRGMCKNIFMTGVGRVKFGKGIEYGSMISFQSDTTAIKK